MDWHRMPLLRLLLPFVAGILFARYVGLPSEVYYVLIALSTIYLFTLTLTKKQNRAKLSLSVWAGVAINIAMFAIGGFSYNYNQPKNNNVQLLAYNKVLARVLTPPLEKNNTYQLIVQAQWGETKGELQQTSGKAILYIDKKGYDSTLHYGDYIWVNAPLQSTQAPQNPAEFDYSAWLAQQNIYHTAYLQKGKYAKTNLHSSNTVFAFAYNARRYFSHALQSTLPDGVAYSLASALILGQRSLVDDDILDAFAHTGTIHILAVSGLHVGAVYLLLVFITMLLPQKRWGMVIRLLLTIGGLWLYAVLTGLSPSVVRATIMFSFIALGKVINRKTNVFNLLAAAALFTLCVDPKAMFTIGFQLSYIAVAGLGVLYKPLYNLLTPKTALLRHLWQLLCASMAAQLSTFPLAVYYFHQFPNYFLLSNLLIVPLAMLAVYLGVLLLLLSPFAAIAAWVSKLLGVVLAVTVWVVQTINSLPFASTQNIYFSPIAVGLLYALLAFGFIYIITKKYKYLVLGIAMCIGLATLHFVRVYQTAQINQFTVYSLPKGHTAFSFVAHNTAMLYADSLLTTESKLYKQKIAPHFLQSGVDKVSLFSSNKFSINHTGVIALHGQKILWLTQATPPEVVAAQKFDVVIVDGSPNISLHRLAQENTVGQVVLTANNTAFAAKKWQQQAKELNIKVHSVRQQGAYRLNFLKHE